MKALRLRTTIAPDGTIDLHVPSDLPAGEAEVVILVQPAAPALPQPPYPLDHGVWNGHLPDGPSKTCSGLFLGRLPEDYDIDAAVDEMNAQWKAKVEDLGRES
jgi:hypothetical protein